MRFRTIWTMPACSLKEKINRSNEEIIRRFAHHLPRRLAYFSFIDTGVRYMENNIVTDITYMEILEKFGKEID